MVALLGVEDEVGLLDEQELGSALEDVVVDPDDGSLLDDDENWLLLCTMIISVTSPPTVNTDEVVSHARC